MTLFAFRGVKSHGWTFYDTIKVNRFILKQPRTPPEQGVFLRIEVWRKVKHWKFEIGLFISTPSLLSGRSISED